MNRQQKRAAAKINTGRIRKMDQRQYHAYQARAKLWAKGCRAIGHHVGDKFEGEWRFPAHVPADKRESVAEYATHSPLRWRCIARCLCKTQAGEWYEVERDAECGQSQIISELQELRNQLMADARQDANANHIYDELFEMECLG